MENKEEVLQALDEFAKLPSGKIPLVLEQYLCRIATTGVTAFPWSKLKPLLIHKLDTVVQEFQQRYPMSSQSASPNVEHVTFDVMRKRLIDDINQFSGIPFTIQRLCELVTNPMKHYQKTDKYMRGVEKNLVVVTTVDPYGNRIVNENKLEVNGIEKGAAQDLLSHSESLIGSFLPPVPLPASTTGAPSAWFSGLSSVVDSPSSYPNWSNQDTADAKNSPADEDESLEPPRKMIRLDNDGANSGIDGTTVEDPSAESSGEEQKAIAPLLTQLLSTSGVVEQTVLPELERQKSEESGGDSDTETKQEERDGQRAALEDEFSLAAGDNVNCGVFATVSVAASDDDACDSTEASNSFSSGEDASRDMASKENQFSDSCVSTSDESTMNAVSVTGENSFSQSNVDSSGLQEANHNFQSPAEHAENRLTESDLAQVTTPSEWSNLNDSSNIDSVNNEGSDCGVDSLMETSNIGASCADVGACDILVSTEKLERENRECEPTSEAWESSSSDITTPASCRFTGDENELEHVGSSIWSSDNVLTMDTD